jgi:hypothetical protein
MPSKRPSQCQAMAPAYLTSKCTVSANLSRSRESDPCVCLSYLKDESKQKHQGIDRTHHRVVASAIVLFLTIYPGYLLKS